MKLHKFLFAAVAVMAITSCAKDGAAEKQEPQAREAKVKVILTSAVTSKATEATTLPEEQQVDNFAVFLFRADGTRDGADFSNTPLATELDIAGTTAASSVYVLVNTGSIGEGLVSTVATKDDLLAAVGDLMSAPNTSSQTGTALWMSGNGMVGPFSNEALPLAEAQVQVYFVASKIIVNILDERENNGPDISIVDNKIVLLFAGAEGKFFEKTIGDREVQNSFYTGDNSYTAPFQTGVTVSDELSEDYATGGVYFYTFANNGAVKPTILAIQSTKTIAGTPNQVEKIYYPAHFTLTDLGHTVVPGKAYTVNITLTGDINSGGGGGTTKPEEELRPASINVTVSVNDWVTVTLPKPF